MNYHCGRISRYIVLIDECQLIDVSYRILMGKMYPTAECASIERAIINDVQRFPPAGGMKENNVARHSCCPQSKRR